MRLQYFLIALLVLIPVVSAKIVPYGEPFIVIKNGSIVNLPAGYFNVTAIESDKIFSMTTNNVCLSKPLFYLLIGIIVVLLIVTLWIWFTSRFVF